MASSLSHFPATSSGRSSSSDLLRSSFSGTMVPANMRRKRSSVARRKTSTVVCFMNLVRFWKKKKHEYPWPNAKDVDPNVKGGMVSYLSDFKLLKEKPKPVILPFEKYVKDLEKEINDIRKVAEETGAESPQINSLIAKLEKNYEQAQNQLYSKLTPIQRLTFARHPNRPTFLDHVLNMTDMWVELHGDRAGYDDPAIVTGLGSIDGKTYMLIGHQKGRNTKENIHRNFAMPTPHGYRKALRMMRYADHHGFPIITFIDTPGAFPDIKSEHKGQGEAIAFNLRTMFGLKVPIVTVVIGEGGSGGALAIGCGNKILMLENSVFYVASPEACASILWKNPKAVPKAAERLKITATELCKLKIADGVIPEPLGGAHMDPFRSSQQIKIAVLEAMNELSAMDTETLLDNRRLKFRILGSAKEAEETDAKKTRNMKKEDRDFGSEIKILKDQLLHSKESTNQTWNLQFDEFFESLEKAISQEYSDAIHALGFQSRLDKLRKEVAKARRSPDQPLEPALQDKMDKLNKEFERKLAEAPNAPSLKAMLSVLDEAIKVKKISEKRQMAERLNNNLENRERLKQETNRRLKEALESSSIKGKLEALKEEVSQSGASNWEDLDEGLKDNITKMKKEIQLTLSDTLKSMQLNAEKQVSQSAEYNDQRLSELKDQLVDLSEQIKKEVMHVIDSMGLKSKIKTLKMEAAKAGKSSNVDVSNKIKRLEERMKQAVKEVMGSSELVKKHQMLVQELRNAKIQASSAEDNQSSGGNAGKETALSSTADAFHDLV